MISNDRTGLSFPLLLLFFLCVLSSSPADIPIREEALEALHKATHRIERPTARRDRVEMTIFSKERAHKPGSFFGYSCESLIFVQLFSSTSVYTLHSGQVCWSSYEKCIFVPAHPNQPSAVELCASE